MKREILLCLAVGWLGLWSVDEVFAIGGRAIGGGAASARPAGGAAINRSPTMSRPQTANLPANRPATPVNRPTTLPAAPANRPAIGNLDRPAQLPADRPTTLPAAPANRPAIGNLDRPTTLPSVPANRPAIGNLDRPAIGNLPNVGSPGAIARPANPIANPGNPFVPPGNRPTAGDLGNLLNLPAQLPAAPHPGVADRLPVNTGERPTQLPANAGGRFDSVQQNRGDRQENRQQWRSDFSQNSQDRQKQRQDRASDVRNDWHQNWHGFWNEFHNDFGQPGWRLQYPHLAHGYFHYRHPYAHGWWTFATVAALTNWWAYPSSGAPVYYDYGSGGNVFYQGDTVYINNQPAYTAEQYAEQAASLAQTGAQQLASTDATPMEWLPLGVFALSTGAAEASPTRMFQLAVSKEGVINGTFYNTDTDETLPILGAVDPKTQRASWYVGDNRHTVAETGIYNLTLDEAPVLIHFGTDRTEEYLLVRLDPPPESEANGAAQ
jgi:hypothetical protein